MLLNKLFNLHIQSKHWIYTFNPHMLPRTVGSPDPLTAGVANIQVFIFYSHIKYPLLNMLKIKCDIKQQYLKTDDLHFVKYE